MIRFTGWANRLSVLALLAAAITVTSSSGAWAQADPAPPVHKHKRVVSETTTTTTYSSEQQQRIDKLSRQLEEMQKQQTDLMSQIKDMKQQMAVQAPAAPVGAPSPATAPPPGTIGEHVATVEGDLAQTKKDLQTNLGVSIHGLVDAGYQHNFNQPIHETNNLRSFDAHDGFQLTQGNLHIEKDGTVGFVTDINVGQVAESINSASHFSNAPADSFTGRWIDPTQYYLTYTVPIGSGLNLQAGRMVTLLGEEVIPTYTNQNFNESRGYLFNLGEPLTHTGIRGTYAFNDYFSATGGLNNGWDDPGNINNGGPNYEGELILNNKDKSVVLTLNGMYGPNQINHSNSNRLAVDPIIAVKPPFIPNTTFATELLYGTETGHVSNGHSATWEGIAQYFVYDLNEWEFATRGEIFDDLDGSRSGTHQTLWEATQTVTYKVPGVTGLLVRGEFQHDNSNKHVFNNNKFVNPLTGAQHLWKGQDTLLGTLIYFF